jgi:VCBS repeat-containing protein
MALAKGVPAQDIFTYTVKDAGGKSATAQLVIKVTGTNDAPVAKALSRSITEKDAALNIQANFEDVDQGDTHVITVNSSGTIGKVVLNGDGTFSYDPNGKFGALGAGKTATDTFSYTVDDGKGGSSTQTVTITINGVNDDPTLISDFNGVVKNGRISVAADNGVLANDSDIDDGDKLAVSSINGSSSSLGSAVEGKYGALTMNADGSYSYAANTQPGALPAKMVAQDHFTYTVSDGEDGLKTETLIVTVHERGQTYIRGTDGANSLIGGNGSDVLDGGNGNDILFGGNGADALLGGRGDDIMTGGAGSDTFVFNANFGRDTITDFNKGLDALQFDKNVFADFASVLASATQSGNDVIIQAGGGNTITLQNFLLSNLSGSDFLFV